MLDEKAKKEILSSLELLGSVDEQTAERKLFINRNVDENVLDKTNGLGRIKTNLRNKFELIAGRPSEIESISHLDIRCLNCKRVVNYPCWMLKLVTVRNEFYYFLCLDKDDRGKVSLGNCK